jgi:hypothetical protein
MKKIFMSLCIIIYIFILISGCTESPDINNGGKTQTEISFTEIRICDSPSENFSSINIMFSEVKLFINETGWISFLSEPKIIDLMYLHINNLTEQLGFKDIAIGNYTSLWILVDNATAVLSATGETVFFNVSSDALKIQHLFDFDKGNNTITVEINLDDSIHIFDNEYKLIPVLSELNVNYSNGTQIRFRNNERIMNYANGTEIRVQDENTLQNMIGNRKPTIDITVNGKRGNTFQFKINQTITFNASGTIDIDNDPLIFSWNFGDNTSSTANIVTHNYSHEGTYQIRLTVSDTELKDTITIFVKIINTGPQDNG